MVFCAVIPVCSLRRYKFQCDVARDRIGVTLGQRAITGPARQNEFNDLVGLRNLYQVARADIAKRLA